MRFGFYHGGSIILRKFSTIKLAFLLLTIVVTATYPLPGILQRRKKIDGHTVEIAINRNPPIVAKNELRVEIKDPHGKNVYEI